MGRTRRRRASLEDAEIPRPGLTGGAGTVFALQRRRAWWQGQRGGLVGAVSFIQFCGSALQGAGGGEPILCRDGGGGEDMVGYAPL